MQSFKTRPSVSFCLSFLGLPGSSWPDLLFHFHSNQPITKRKKSFPKLATNICMTCKEPKWPWKQNLVLCGGVIHAKCLIDGSSNEDKNYLVIASNFACLDDRTELGPEALELDGTSSNSDHALTSWTTWAHDFPYPRFPVLMLTSKAYWWVDLRKKKKWVWRWPTATLW